MLSRITANPPTRLGVGGAALAGIGLVLIAVGTFLPWVRSGTVLRDSYESLSVIRHIELLDSPLQTVLDSWMFVVPAVTVCIAAYALGFRRVAATLSTILAIICGTISGIATVVSGGEEVRLGIAGIGPTTTLIGAVLTVIGVVGIFAGRRKSATVNAGGEA